MQVGRLFTFVLVVLIAAAGCTDSELSVQAEPWPQANQLFRNHPQWVGGDGAYSCDLGPDASGRPRTLWLFGDSSVARTADRDLHGGWFLRNSIGVQTGADPSTALMQFYWRNTDGQPGSFFAERDGLMFWPGPCLRAADRLYVVGGRLRAGSGQFGFAAERPVLFVVDNPDADPSTWQPRELYFADRVVDEWLGTAGVLHDSHWYLYGEVGFGHDYVLSRISLDNLATEQLQLTEFWQDQTWRQADALQGPPDILFKWGAPESSVHWQPELGQFVMAQSEGFGATTLALRTAPRPQGPWSPPQTILRPPESSVAGQNFVYAGKAHSSLTGADLVLTYVPSQFDDIPVRSRPWAYSPHFVRVWFR